MGTKRKTNKSFGYYFLNKRLHPPILKNFRNSMVILVVNKNQTENKDKFLLVKQSNNSWSVPKEGVKSNLVIEDIYTTISANLENELGFKGIKVTETKPLFRQVAILFDFDKLFFIFLLKFYIPATFKFFFRKKGQTNERENLSISHYGI